MAQVSYPHLEEYAIIENPARIRRRYRCRRRCSMQTMPMLLSILLLSVSSNHLCEVATAWVMRPNSIKRATSSLRSLRQSRSYNSIRAQHSPNRDNLFSKFRVAGITTNNRNVQTMDPLRSMNCDYVDKVTDVGNSTDKFTNALIDTVNGMEQTQRDEEPPPQSLSDYEIYQNQKLDLQLILLDNYDSYTYNIYSYLSTICKEPPVVISNDAYDSWGDLMKELDCDVDGIVISPGPGRPERREDMGICLEAIGENPDLPILGICLGHQALGYYYDAEVKVSPFGPVHGLSSSVSYISSPNGNIDGHDSDEMNSSSGDLGKGKMLKCDLFKDIPQSFDVIRYHSLIVEFPSESESKNTNLPIEPIAWCKADTEAESGSEDGEICMALQHKVNPHYGVQFHPESVGTGEFGYRILQNFCEFCAEKCDGRNYDNNDDIKLIRGNIAAGKSCGVSEESNASTARSKSDEASKHHVFVHKITMKDELLPSPEVVFENLFASLDDSFWLDSSTGRKDADVEERMKPNAFGESEGCPIVSNSRFSIMGGNLGPLCKKVEYWGQDHLEENRGLFVTELGNSSHARNELKQDIISYLRGEILKNGMTDAVTEINFDSNCGPSEYSKKSAENIPFEFRGGYVGYLGYEVRHDTRDAICSQEACGVAINGNYQTNDASNPMVPTAAFLFADRSLVYDHWRDDWYVISVDETSDPSANVVPWMKEIATQIYELTTHDKSSEKSPVSHTNQELYFNLNRSKKEYSADIVRCHEEIKNGESYELCLTNQLSTNVSFPEASSDQLYRKPFGLYKILRSKNPAPFAAFMNFRNKKLDKTDVSQNESFVSICCSSPERFLSVTKYDESATISLGDERNNLDHGWQFAPPFVSKSDKTAPRLIVESKPIKGTASRIITKDGDPDFHERNLEDKAVAKELQQSIKNRAENLMIVDLLRNDLSRVCEPGSVHVPKLMGIESFATVHQMVSTIRGFVDETYTPIDVAAACFPGGSMTGAPKLRSVDILNKLELGNSRGPYSGCLGYISLNGSMDLNIVIRTAVVTPVGSVGSDENNDNTSWDVNIGAGGAITALSDIDDEFEEMLLKASAIKKSVQQWYDDGQS